VLSTQNPTFKIQNFLIPPFPLVAVFATTLGSGFVEMIFSLSEIQRLKSNISACYALPVTRHSGCATILLPVPILLILQILSSCLKFTRNPKSKIQNFLIPSVPPVAVFATTLGSGFVEMILHPLPIQQFIKIKFKKSNN